MTPEEKAAKQAQTDRRKHSSYKKWDGDDAYSYALFIRGRVAYSGMSRSEAKWRRDRYVETGEL